MQSGRWTSSVILIAIAAVLFLLVLRFKLQGGEVPTALTILVASAFGGVILLATWFLVRALKQHRESEERFQQMATNIREIFWMIDVKSGRALYVNAAYETITGRSCQSLTENPTSYAELIHPEDRSRVFAKLEEAKQMGYFSEQFRILCADGEERWVHLCGFPVRNSAGEIWRLVGTAQEITEQKHAEDQVVRNLAMAEAAREEADALRKATVALTQDLHMGYVLEALLCSLEELIPYTCARVLVPEGGPHVRALGERFIPENPTTAASHSLALMADNSPVLRRLLEERKSVLLPDTEREKDWHTFEGHHHLRSWLSVPLVASAEYLGFLSIGHKEPNRYTKEHLRRAELLAIPAAVAIQNARLFARADMYASELEKRLADLREAETALAQAKGDRQVPEDNFRKVFRACPVPFSITTLEEGRFLDVNAAFEHRYGYSRQEVLGRTVHDLKIWEDPKYRMLMTEQLRRGSPVRNVITRLRTKSGELKLTVYSAERICFDGQCCIIAVSEDVPEYDQDKAN
jgi:PAS domain S-box-containing protein